jgi:acyl-coenzyme A synthetase/AMP-(fatty) acid ligase
MPGCTTAIVNSDGNPCETGERGELALIGPQVMAGYWKDPKKTSTDFLDVMVGDRMQRAYRSGDIAFVNEREQIIYCGRLDSQVKIDGHRVELGEIEHCARRFLGSPKAAVVLAADPGGQSVLHLFIAAECVDINELQRHLQSEMPAYMCPRHIRLLDDLPVNLNGKIDRKALANMID